MIPDPEGLLCLPQEKLVVGFLLLALSNTEHLLPVLRQTDDGFLVSGSES